MVASNHQFDADSSTPRPRPFVARLIQSGIRRSLGDIPGGLDEYAAPLGDPGLFGPDAMAWRVHADLPGMLIGGFAALMLQMLHPLAMAGVAAHSRFREDPLGRLQRTGRFVAGTTFGPMSFVDELIAEVRDVHSRVNGIAPDGRCYSAADPELLTFVHVSEVSSFLAGYQRYSLHPLLRVEKDQYFEEVAEVARRLGASDVPTSLDAVRAYLRDIQPELGRSGQTDEAMRFLSRPIGTGIAEVATHRLLMAAAADLLPRPARDLLGVNLVVPGSRAAVRAAAGAFCLSTRWALGPSPVVARSRSRATVDDDQAG
jgi:uncharacterized protein (DUF2236 family)